MYCPCFDNKPFYVFPRDYNDGYVFDIVTYYADLSKSYFVKNKTRFISAPFINI